MYGLRLDSTNWRPRTCTLGRCARRLNGADVGRLGPTDGRPLELEVGAGAAATPRCRCLRSAAAERGRAGSRRGATRCLLADPPSFQVTPRLEPPRSGDVLRLNELPRSGADSSSRCTAPHPCTGPAGDWWARCGDVLPFPCRADASGDVDARGESVPEENDDAEASSHGCLDGADGDLVGDLTDEAELRMARDTTACSCALGPKLKPATYS